MWAVEMYQRSEIQKWISRQYEFVPERDVSQKLSEQVC